MVLAFTLVKASIDTEKELYRVLKNIEGVKSIYHIFGDYDFFLAIEVPYMNDLTGTLKRIVQICFVSEVKTILVGFAGKHPDNSHGMGSCSYYLNYEEQDCPCI